MSPVTQPYRQEAREGALWLTLDTPASDVNIFNNDAAAQILDILGNLPPGVRAVVFATGKPESFINGVSGLLTAVAAKTPRAAGRLTDLVRQAYHAVRSCPVPTIAAIQGNCYGCGVEFTLRCDYRIAADTSVTHFYMTEINDYLLLPIFEATLRLPLLVGLDRAVDLMLWGARWFSSDAHAAGLVDRVFEAGDFREGVSRHVEKAARNGARREKQPRQTPEEIEAIVVRTRGRIEQLPPAYHRVYNDCLDLMARVAMRGRATVVERAMEIARSGQSGCRPLAKRALSFFFIRQVAHSLALAQARSDERQLLIKVAGGDAKGDAFRADLSSRNIPGVVVENGKVVPERAAAGSLGPDRAVMEITPAGSSGSDHHAELALAVSMETVQGDSPDQAVLYSPWYPAGPPLLEIALRGEASADARLAYRRLTDAGFCVVLSRPRGDYALLRFLVAFLLPLVRYLTCGGSTESINQTLRIFGFARRPHDLVGHLDDGVAEHVARAGAMGPDHVREALAALGCDGYTGGSYDGRLIDALCVSLLACARQCQDDATLPHPSVADLIAREALAFPLQQASLGTYLGTRRLRDLTARATRFGDLVMPADLDQLEMVSGGVYL